MSDDVSPSAGLLLPLWVVSAGREDTASELTQEVLVPMLTRTASWPMKLNSTHSSWLASRTRVERVSSCSSRTKLQPQLQELLARLRMERRGRTDRLHTGKLVNRLFCRNSTCNGW